MYVPYVVVGCLDMKDKKIWKIYVKDNLCIRCGKFIDAQTYFGVLCQKCNELWIEFAQENGISPLYADSKKKFWYSFIDMNPSSRL
jgi:hypothetical protein